MSVNWECGKCQAYKDVVKLDEDSKEWREFCDLRESLIWVMLAVKFPAKSSWGLNKKNWKEVYRRIAIYEMISGCMRVYSVSDTRNAGPSLTEKREVFFKPAEIESMIGFSVNCGNASETEFKKLIFKKMDDDVNGAMNRYLEDRDDE